MGENEPCKVVVCDFTDAINNLPERLSEIGFKVEATHLVLVKPNICGLYHPSLDLLSSILEYLSPRVKLVTIGETGTIVCDPNRQFERLGVEAMLNRFGGRVNTADLSGDELVEVKVPHPHSVEKIVLPKKALEYDLIINVPKAGTLPTTDLTCALKNLFGLLPKKRNYYWYHPFGGMHKVIADVAQVVKPDLNIVDVGSKVILGTDALAVDVVACKFVDLDPLTIGHLKLVSEDRNMNLETFVNTINIVEY